MKVQEEICYDDDTISINKLIPLEEQQFKYILCIVLKTEIANEKIFNKMNNYFIQCFNGEFFNLYIDFSNITSVGPIVLKNQIQKIKEFSSNPKSGCKRCCLVLGEKLAKITGSKTFEKIIKKSCGDCIVDTFYDKKEAYNLVKTPVPEN